MKIHVYGQIDDKPLARFGTAEGTPREIPATLAQLLRSAADEIEQTGTFIDIARRFDEDDQQ